MYPVSSLNNTKKKKNKTKEEELYENEKTKETKEKGREKKENIKTIEEGKNLLIMLLRDEKCCASAVFGSERSKYDCVWIALLHLYLLYALSLLAVG